MDKAHPPSSPVIVQSLNIKDDPFRLREENEEILGPEVSYLSAIGALMNDLGMIFMFIFT